MQQTSDFRTQKRQFGLGAALGAIDPARRAEIELSLWLRALHAAQVGTDIQWTSELCVALRCRRAASNPLFLFAKAHTELPLPAVSIFRSKPNGRFRTKIDTVPSCQRRGLLCKNGCSLARKATKIERQLKRGLFSNIRVQLNATTGQEEAETVAVFGNLPSGRVPILPSRVFTYSCGIMAGPDCSFAIWDHKSRVFSWCEFAASKSLNSQYA